jgi:hypothetical protein
LAVDSPSRRLLAISSGPSGIPDSLRHDAPIPLRRATFQPYLVLRFAWYNEHWPHMSLRGRTPNEVYFRKAAAQRRPRLEPRPHWPRGAPCARTRTLVAGQPGCNFTLEVQFHGGRRSLPIVTLRRAA